MTPVRAARTLGSLKANFANHRKVASPAYSTLKEADLKHVPYGKEGAGYYSEATKVTFSHSFRRFVLFGCYLGYYVER